MPKCLICGKQFVKSKFHPRQKTCHKRCSRKLEYQKHKKDYFKRAKKWIKANPDKVREIHRRNYAKHRDKKRLQKKARNTGHISRKNWVSLCKKHKFICQLCFRKFPLKDLSIDHIFPSSLGGSNKTFNLQPACLPCNRKKGNRL